VVLQDVIRKSLRVKLGLVPYVLQYELYVFKVAGSRIVAGLTPYRLVHNLIPNVRYRLYHSVMRHAVKYPVVKQVFVFYVSRSRYVAACYQGRYPVVKLRSQYGLNVQVLRVQYRHRQKTVFDVKVYGRIVFQVLRGAEVCLSCHL